MNEKRLIALAVAGALGVPTFAGAAEHDVQVYGKAHLSIDAYSDARVNNDPTGEEDSGISVSSNSSRFGLKGSHKIENAPTLIWQYESQINIDDGNGSLANRNTFVGFKGGWGKIIAGNHDTPLKRALTKWDPFNETVGEGRAVFGQEGGTSGAATDFNVRAKNSVMYFSPSLAGFKLVLQYSADVESGSEGDNNNRALYDIGFEFKTKDKKWAAWGAYENQDEVNAAGDSADAIRLSGLGNFGPVGVGLLYESVDDPDAGSRDGVGAWVAFKFGGPWTFKGAYYGVDEYDNAPDTDAAVYSIGADYKMDSATKVYVMASTLDQGNDADYRMGRRGHGDRYRALQPGGDPSAFSVGVIYKF
jgi:predicted porin